MELESRVDILMATFNGELFIREQIESIRRQTHRSWKLIIRDDGSNDRTRDICRDAAKGDTRIVFVEDDIGNLGFNLNYFRLLELSTASYTMFCDQDDVWLEEKILETLKVTKGEEALNPDIPVMAHCDSFVTDIILNPIRDHFVRNRAKHSGLRSVLLANPAQGATIMINKRLRALMLLHEPQVPYDYQASLFAEATGKRIFINKSLMMYRQHGANAIGATARISKHSDQKIIRSKLTPTLALGINGAQTIERTLSLVKDHWKPGVRQEIQRLSRLASAGFSFSRLYYAIAGGFQFYRRKDRINLVLYALGLPSMPN